MESKLLIFPNQADELTHLIKGTKKQILVSSQVLPKKQFCDLLIDLAKRQVDVKIFLSDPRYFQLYSREEICEFHQVHGDIVHYSKKKLPCGEKNLFLLNQAGLYPHFINHEKHFLNHSKYLIMDGEQAFIGSSVYSRESKIDFGLVLKNKKSVSVLHDLFFKDYYNQDHHFTATCENLAIAPYDMRKKLQQFIESARHSILIISTAITDDPEIFNLLETKVKEGVKLNVLCSSHVFSIEGQTHKSIVDHFYNLRLQNLGATLKITYNPIIHSKSIIVDHENKNRSKAYIGSANFRTSSLDKSREVGIFSNESHVINAMMNFFSITWNESVEYR